MEKGYNRSRRKLVLISLPIILIIFVVLLLIWTLSDDQTELPEGRPVLMGLVDDIQYNTTFVVQTMDRRMGGQPGNFSFEPGERLNVTLDGHTKIFRMNGRPGERRVECGSKKDIHIGSRIAVWGTQQSNGTWYATDVGIMMARQGPPR